MTDVKKELSVLDQVKKLEKFKKAQLLAETIEAIKSKAKEVLLLKEETVMLLEEVGLSSEDSKKVIDYVNSIVKLTKKDREELREKVTEETDEKEEVVKKKMEKQPYPFLNSTFSSISNGNSLTYASNTMANANYTVSLGNDPQYKISL